MSHPGSTLAKISPPRLVAAVVRPRLHLQLDDAAVAGWWIAAPAGAGKTTLAASYLQDRRLSAVWYQFDAGDADPVAFFQDFSAATIAVCADAAQRLPVLTPDQLPALAGYGLRFFRVLQTVLPASFLLVFDNLHHLPADSRLHELLPDMLADLVASRRIVVMSRNEPSAGWARLLMHGGLRMLSGESLRLTLEEAERVAESFIVPAHIDRNMLPIEHLHAACDGWMTGFLLMLRNHCESVPGPCPAETPQLLFDYFEGEVFARHDRPTRELLVQTAVLPEFDAGLAIALTGQRAAPRILAGLVRIGHFIVRQGDSYQYHALFREFLLRRGSQTYSRGRLQQIRRRAARLLNGVGRSEDAIELLLDANDWQAAAASMISCAPVVLGRGRMVTFDTWLRRLPRDVVTASTWLQYWGAVLRLPFDPASVRAELIRHFEAFRTQQDSVGAYLCWTSVTESYFISWQQMAELDVWTETFQALRQALPMPALPAVEAAVALGMFTSVVMRQPDSELADEWCAAAEAQFQHCEDVDYRLRIGTQILLLKLWRGDLHEALRLGTAIDGLLDKQEAAPISVILAASIRAVSHWHVAEFGPVRTLLERIERLANETGVHAGNAVVLAQYVYVELLDGSLEGAERYLVRMADWAVPARAMDCAHYHFLSAWSTWRRGHLQKALDHIDTAVQYGDASGLVFSEAINRLGRAHILTDLGQPVAAGEDVAHARALAVRMRSDVLLAHCAYIEAWIALEAGDRVRLYECLRAALQCYRLTGMRVTLLWHPQQAAVLLGQALSAGIECDYARDLIRWHSLCPTDPAAAPEAWPWPIRIYTLGRFSVVCDDKALKCSIKAQRRPLDLLRALLAQGGRASIVQLAEMLWPDADGDAAVRAFKTTLHRLRRLLGHEQALRVDDGRLYLDTRYCWVDMLAFERAAKQAHACGACSSTEFLERAFALYAGAFLADDPDKTWADSRRERLRGRFATIVQRLAEQYAENHEVERALKLYHRALDIDPKVHSLYSAAIDHCVAQGHAAGGLAMLERCQALVDHAQPNPAVESLVAACRDKLADMRTYRDADGLAHESIDAPT